MRANPRNLTWFKTVSSCKRVGSGDETNLTLGAYMPSVYIQIRLLLVELPNMESCCLSNDNTKPYVFSVRIVQL